MARSIRMYFASLPDPRGDHGKRHQLNDMLTIAILAVICGAEGWTSVEEFGRAKQKWLKTFLNLAHGIPSHDTFGDVFARLDPDAFEQCFRRWTEAVAGELTGVVAIDGKTIRRSFDRASKQAAIHMISAWAADNSVVFGQIATEARSNEITAIPKLLNMLDIKGTIVTIDAMGTQKSIAKTIIKRGGDYVLQVKANQAGLLRDITELFQWAETRQFRDVEYAQSEQTEKGHGRIETRRACVIRTLNLITDRKAWPKLRCVVRVECERRIGSETATETHYYISSVESQRSEELARICRRHWSIENGLHWSLDVSFGEDDSRVRKGHAAENLSRLRRMALNLLKLETSRKIGIKNKRLRAGWDHDYLLKVLGA